MIPGFIPFLLKAGTVVGGFALLGGGVAFKMTKKKVLKRCKTVDRRDYQEVPLFTQQYCAIKAEEICKT